MSIFTATVDLSEFTPAVNETHKELSRQTVRAVNAAGEAGLATAKDGPFKDRSGKLRREIRLLPTVAKREGAECILESPTSYGPIVEDGSRAHKIFPKLGRTTSGPLRQGQTRGRGKAKPYLVFRYNGRLIFARSVNHPGSRAYPYMGPAFLKAEAVLIKYGENIETRIASIWR